MLDQSRSSRTRRRLQVFAAVAVLAAIPALASAGTYVVTLHSGAKFESRYKPTVAGWDANKVMVLAESGNWVALSRADIATVRSTSESRGLGFVINNSTIALGWAPNDNLTPEDEAAAMEMAARDALLSPQPAPNYTVQQFVEPNQAQGIPAGLIGSTSDLVPQVGFGLPRAIPVPVGDGGGRGRGE